MPTFGGSIGEVAANVQFDRNITAPIGRDNISGELAQKLGSIAAEAPSQFRQGMLKSDIKSLETAFVGGPSPAKEKAVARTQKLFERMKIAYDAGNMSKTQFDITSAKLLKEATASFPSKRAEFVGTISSVLGYDPTGAEIKAAAKEEADATQEAANREKQYLAKVSKEYGEMGGAPSLLFHPDAAIRDAVNQDYQDRLRDYTTNKTYEVEINKLEVQNKEQQIGHDQWKRNTDRISHLANSKIGSDVMGITNSIGNRLMASTQGFDLELQSKEGEHPLEYIDRMSRDSKTAPLARQALDNLKNNDIANVTAYYTSKGVSDAVLKANIGIINTEYDYLTGIMDKKHDLDTATAMSKVIQAGQLADALNHPEIGQLVFLAKNGLLDPKTMAMHFKGMLTAAGTITRSNANRVTEAGHVFVENIDDDITALRRGAFPAQIKSATAGIDGSKMLSSAVAVPENVDNKDATNMINSSLIANLRRKGKSAEDMYEAIKIAADNPEQLTALMKQDPSKFSIYKNEVNREGSELFRKTLDTIITRSIGSGANPLVGDNGNLYFDGGGREMAKVAETINTLTDSLAVANEMGDDKKIQLKKGMYDMVLMTRFAELNKLDAESFVGQIKAQREGTGINPAGVLAVTAGSVAEVVANIFGILGEAATQEILSPLAAKLGTTADSLMKMIMSSTEDVKEVDNV